MGLQTKYFLFSKLFVPLFLSFMSALNACVGEDAELMRVGERRAPHLELHGLKWLLFRRLTMFRMSGFALQGRSKSRWLGTPSQRDSSLRLFFAIAAALAAAFVVLMCFKNAMAKSAGSARPRSLDGGRQNDELPRCPVRRSSCWALAELPRN